MDYDADNAEKRLRRVPSATSVQVTDEAIRMRYTGLWGTLAVGGGKFLPSRVFIHIAFRSLRSRSIYFPLTWPA
jgi:hypothetical protein